MSIKLNSPKFRSDLEITPRLQDDGSFTYLAKDKNSDQLFELREEDYFICRQLNGKSSLQSIQAIFQARFGVAMQLKVLEAFVRRLNKLGFLVAQTRDEKLSWPYAERVKLHQFFNPDLFLTRLAPGMNWCFSRGFLSGVLLFTLIALGITFKHGDSFIYEFSWLWERGRFLWVVILGIVFTNFLGEFAKGFRGLD